MRLEYAYTIMAYLEPLIVTNPRTFLDATTCFNGLVNVSENAVNLIARALYLTEVAMVRRHVLGDLLRSEVRSV